MRATLLKLLGIFLLLISSLFLAVLVAMSIFDSPEYARRLLMYGQSDINDYLLFPEQAVMNASQASTLSISNGSHPQSINVPYAGGERSENIADLNQRGDSRAFIVVKDDQIIYVAPRKNMVIVRLGSETDERLPWPLIIHSLVDQID
jgi:hypothetical protein